MKMLLYRVCSRTIKCLKIIPPLSVIYVAILSYTMPISFEVMYAIWERVVLILQITFGRIPINDAA